MDGRCAAVCEISVVCCIKWFFFSAIHFYANIYLECLIASSLNRQADLLRTALLCISTHFQSGKVQVKD